MTNEWTPDTGERFLALTVLEVNADGTKVRLPDDATIDELKFDAKVAHAFEQAMMQILTANKDNIQMHSDLAEAYKELVTMTERMLVNLFDVPADQVPHVFKEGDETDVELSDWIKG